MHYVVHVRYTPLAYYASPLRGVARPGACAHINKRYRVACSCNGDAGTGKTLLILSGIKNNNDNNKNNGKKNDQRCSHENRVPQSAGRATCTMCLL